MRSQIRILIALAVIALSTAQTPNAVFPGDASVKYVVDTFPTDYVGNAAAVAVGFRSSVLTPQNDDVVLVFGGQQNSWNFNGWVSTNSDLWWVHTKASPRSFTKLAVRNAAGDLLEVSRANAGMAIDSVNSRLWIYGGLEGGALKTTLGEVWEFAIPASNVCPTTGSKCFWSKRVTSSGAIFPEARGEFPIVYHSSGYVIGYGGLGASKLFGDVWKWDVNTFAWTEVAMSNAGPGARRAHAVALLNNRFFAYGGAYMNYVQQGGGSYEFVAVGTMFSFDLLPLETSSTSIWVETSLNIAPPALTFIQMAAMPSSGLLVLHGGSASTSYGGVAPAPTVLVDPSSGAVTEVPIDQSGNSPEYRTDFAMAMPGDSDESGIIAVFGTYRSDPASKVSTWAAACVFPSLCGPTVPATTSDPIAGTTGTTGTVGTTATTRTTGSETTTESSTLSGLAATTGFQPSSVSGASGSSSIPLSGTAGTSGTSSRTVSSSTVGTTTVTTSTPLILTTAATTGNGITTVMGSSTLFDGGTTGAAVSSTSLTLSTGSFVPPTSNAIATSVSSPVLVADAVSSSSSLILPVVFVLIFCCCCLLVAAIIFWTQRRRRRGARESSSDSVCSESVDMVASTTSARSRTGSQASQFGRDARILRGVTLGGKIGAGAFGAVFKGEWSGSTVALKAVEDALEMKREAALLADLDHPHVVHFLGCTQVAADDTDVDGRWFMVFEYAAKGDVLSWLRSRKIHAIDKIRIVTEACSGMTYLSDQGIVHRDLAARNVLVTESDSARITDFGLARALNLENTDTYNVSSKTQIPVRWSPVEVLSQQSASSKSDVFSFGVTVWEILSGGLLPFVGMDNTAVASVIAKGREAIMEVLCEPAGSPPELYAIASDCWHLSPDNRPTFAALLSRLKDLAGANSAEVPERATMQLNSAANLYSHNSDNLYSHTPAESPANFYGSLHGSRSSNDGTCTDEFSV